MPQVHSHLRIHSNDPNLIGSSRPEDPNFPPESITISTTKKIESWLEHTANAAPIYEREDSTKGSTNPKNHQYSSYSNDPVHSKRFSGTLKATAKAPIIALPHKIQNNTEYVGHSTRSSNSRIFPKKGANRVRVLDPGSPKVSCFGRVLSVRENDQKKLGCFRKILGLLRRRKVVEVQKNIPAKETYIPSRRSVLEKVDPPGLGGMRKFTSVRRSASWGGDDDLDADSLDDGHVAWSGPLVRRN